MENEHARFSKMKNEIGIVNSDIADATGNSSGSVRTTTQPNRPLPRNLKLSILLHEWYWNDCPGSFKDFIKENK